MGNEISTLGGALSVVGTSIAAGVTFGQVDSLNNAVKETAKFTGQSFMKTNVRHVGELAGVSIAAAATLGQCEAVNKCVVRSAPACGKTLLTTVNDVANGTPGVGHIKGCIHYAVGDQEGGDQAMKSASRTVGVVGGAVGGAMLGGPVGAVAGAVAGGAAMDGITTGVDSAVHHEYRPAGQVASWTQAIKNEDPGSLIEGIVGIAATPAMDAAAGYSTGAAALKKLKPKTTRVYSVAPENAVNNMVEQQKLTQNPRAVGRPLGETCVTESATKHSRGFIMDRQKQHPDVKMACAKIKVDTEAWKLQKAPPHEFGGPVAPADAPQARSIPQKNSRAINQARVKAKQRPFNVTTKERLGDSKSGKVNVNIKGADNLQDFNGIVQEVKKIDPTSLKYKNGFTKNVYRLGPHAALADVAAGGAAAVPSRTRK